MTGATQPRAAPVAAYRIWPPVAVGLPLLCGWLVTRLGGDPWQIPGALEWLGWGLIAFFAFWNGWSLAMFQRRRTGLLPGQPTRTLMTSGPFAVSRNPLYLGLMALYLGTALLLPSVWALVAAPVAFLALDRGAIRPEETMLEAEFGAVYRDYAHAVRRWL